ncbi:hypothetical protein L6452_01728 [Arctium lappa]|uniref:Uncharacterized protein n=1 Tax=Arctium lappa TaxID=4217 RepID=A0ACB9FGX7_ARCLA|nr:hypothetical protein L6452_01728 [Arctium lappa]
MFQDNIYDIDEMMRELDNCRRRANIASETADAFKQMNSQIFAERDKLKNQVFSLEVELNMLKEKEDTKKAEKKRKDLENENAELKKKISEFEKERKDFAKKFFDFSRKAFEEKKVVEMKCIKLSQKVSDFEKVIILEREKFEKEKKKIVETQTIKEDFTEEKKVFETEIAKLTKKLSELSSTIFKEKNVKEIMFKVKLTEHKTPESIAQSPRDNLAASECSFKSAASNIKKKESQKKMTWRKKDEKDKENWYWRVKGSSEEKKKEEKSFGHTFKAQRNNSPKGKTFGKPDLIYTVNQLIRHPRFKGEKELRLLNKSFQNP